MKYLIFIFSLLFFSTGPEAKIPYPYWKKISLNLNDWHGVPIKIVMVSDLHLGHGLQKKFMQSIVERINEKNPDLVVIAGDLTSMNAHTIKDMLSPLKDLKTKQGIYFVPGNHDYYHGLEILLDVLPQLNVTALVNRNVIIKKQFNLVGLGDTTGRREHYLPPDYQAAFEGIDNNLPTILLTHKPRQIRSADTRVDLALAGHTHNGQILPLKGFAKLYDHYLYGLYKFPGNRFVYVSSGAGVSQGIPFRMATNSEIVEIDLGGKEFQ